MTWNFDELLENAAETLPRGWQSEFGRYDFSYVVGIRDCFELRADIGGSARIQELLKQEKDEAFELLPADWFKKYTGDDKPDDVQCELVGNWNLEIVGNGVLGRASAIQPISFSKAILSVVCANAALNRLAPKSSEEPTISIRLAVYTVPYLDKFLPQLSELDIMRLTNELGGPYNETPLRELALGFPVTRKFAETVTKHLQVFSDDKILNWPISVQAYGSRLDISAEVKRLSDGNTSTDKMRVADGEQPTPDPI